MTKSYLKYTPTAPFGLISSGNANTVYDHSGTYAICPGLEDVLIWHLRQGTLVTRWHDNDNTAEVTVIARSSESNSAREIYAVGYSDGSIRLWNLKDNQCVITLNGHKGAVTTLAFDQSGSRLLSGGKDTDIVLWDVLAETGVHRLRGHKDLISWLSFLHVEGKPKYAISTSKDTLVKIWDLETQHCVETVIGHRSEVWSATLLKDETVLITGSSDADIKVFSINKEKLIQRLQPVQADTENKEGEMEVENVSAVVLEGNLTRNSRERVVQLQTDVSERFFGCQTADKTFEIFQIRSEDEIKKKLQRKKKRAGEKGAEDESPKITVADIYVSVRVVKASAKLKSFDFRHSKKNQTAESTVVMFGLCNNSIEVNSIHADNAEISNICTLDIQGHRGDIRAIVLSSDDQILASVGSHTLKVWNVESRQCIRSLDTEGSVAVCCMFLPGNRHVLVGTKAGTLELFDTWSSTKIESIQAHTGTVWTMDLRPDKRGIATGGSDKEVKFWDFSAVEDEEYSKTTRKLTLTHMRTLQMPDEVLCLKHSPNQNLLAISLLDSTIKVFYHDTLKFFLSLYGHKLPVLSMDISSDNNLLVTGSADKNIKLWGLDFGDCHKSIRGHEDSVMQIRFVPQTHYFFSCSKDKTVKYWDADSYDQIMSMSGHHGEVWALALGKWGNIVVSAGHDKSIRMWEKTDEQLFLEEEREREVDEMYEKELLDAQNSNDEVSATKKTPETIRATERLVEALQVCQEHWDKVAIFEKAKQDGNPVPLPDLNPILIANGNIAPELYTLRILEKVPNVQLDQILWLLTFAQATNLLKVLDLWAKQQWNYQLTARISTSLIRIYFRQISASTSLDLRLSVESLKQNLHKQLMYQKNVIGFNLAGSKIIKKLWDQEHIAEFEDWEKELAERVSDLKSSGGKKRKRTVTGVAKETLAS